MRPRNEDPIRELEAEWRALPLMHYAHLKKVLLASGMAPEIVIHQHLGATEITFQGGHVSDKRTLKKFLVSTNQPAELYRLTDVGEMLAIQYKEWLLTQYSERYRAFIAKAHLTWLEQVITIVVKRYIMVNKYEAYIRQQPGAFASPQVALVMTIMMVLHDMEEETPRMVHHIVKDPELLKALMKEYFDSLVLQP